MATNDPIKPTEPVQPAGTQDLEAALRRVQDTEGKLTAAQRELEASKARETALRARGAQAAAKDPNAKDTELREQLEEATRRNLVLETATQFGVKPEDLEGDFQSPEEIRLRAQTLQLQHELARLKEESAGVRDALKAVTDSVRASGEAAAAGTSAEGVLTQAPSPREELRPPAELQKQYDDAAKGAREQRGAKENEGLMRWLTVAHRDPTRRIVRTARDTGSPEER